MKTYLRLLIGLALLLVLFWVMSAITGFLFWGGVAIVVGAVVIALVRGLRRRMGRSREPGYLSEDHTEQSAADTIEALKQDLQRQRMQNH